MIDPGTAIAVTQGLNSGLAVWGQSQANKQNLKIAREQMAFQERMSNSAYQRAVSDMRAAGLNPMLAYGQGGASSPSGASTTMESITSGVSTSAMEVMRAKKELETLGAQAEDVRQSAMNKVAERDLMKDQKEQIRITTQAEAIRKALSEAELPAANARAQMYKDHPEMVYADKALEFIRPFAGGIAPFIGSYFGGREGASAKEQERFSPRYTHPNYDRKGR